ncbi:hypothetical protein J2Z62_000785 [Mycoplasmoides fastidiosum]|uniref:YqaJ viral recombinase domain-containing protein n=1 Tax=Mycoplasmoides fastidiosum TaxID=92758 RepID=A0ABU0M071_9BACT|nr:YqaJ viral recombinase family protein [Mycoplasmoides fastidiosum]MDQ0514347.1 hypothetical protein [Mycoplasmoides fastidiosum]UUD38051.1 YqaJ viral recombinase family protein [Mycoplasmoides fastidiosum]
MEFNKFKPNEFVFQNKQIHLTPAGRQKVYRPKKITGSRLGAILGVDEYSSPFQVWCDMMGFFKTTPDPFFLNAGIVIEPKLREFVESKLNCKFQSYHGPDVGFDVFKTNKYFGGMPDGEPLDPQTNQVNYESNIPMLEIKTTSIDEYFWTKRDNELVLERDENGLPLIKSEGTRFSKWIDQKHIKIRNSYMFQLGLYLYLRNQTKGLFCVAFLETADYLNPENFDLNKNIVLLEEFEMDRQSFQAAIDYAQAWYEAHIVTGISPEMSSADLEWFSYGYPHLK